ncbi:VCBS domain-containing protein, partial [Pseudomonas sp. RIT-PI-AD]|uniref:VCBS domain-containing protein n=1 Tax=Pseudomonas sp. RIT-PI-AD TaxID=3035294 RepID=UPI0021DB6F24
RADLDGWNLDTLSITPPLDFTGHFDLDIGATAVEGANAASAETHLPLTVVVYPESSVPTGPVTGQEGSVQEDVTLSVGSAFGSGGSSFVAGTQSGTYGSLGLTADGRWTYTLDNAAPAVQALVSGQSETETFTLSLSNGTTTTVTVHVLGLDDRAVITPVTPGADRGALVEDNVLTASGTLAVSDPDAGQAGFVAQTLSDGNYGSLSIDASGHWTYTLNNAAQEVQNLKAGDSLTRTLVVTSQDGTSHAITLTIAGANETASAGAGAVQEDTTLSASGTLVASGGATFAAGTQAGTYGSLTLGSDGHWTYVLDNASPQVQALVNGQTETETFTLSLNDGTLTQVAIQVLGLNDTAVIAPAAPGGDRGALVEDSVLTASGTLNVSDADAGQAGFQAQTAVAGQYGHFSVDANGHWTYQLDNAAAQVQALAANEIRTEQFTVTSLDGTPAQVTLTITGTDDAPVIGSGSGSVVEQTQPSVTGSLSATDV